MSAGFAPRRILSTIVGGAPEQVRDVWSIGHQTSRFDVLPNAVHRRQSRAERQVLMRIRLVFVERVDSDIKCVRAALERLEGGRDILRSPDFEWDDFEAERAGRCLNLAHLQHGGGIADIGHDRQPAETGDNLAQEFESLAGKIGRLHRQAGDVAARSRQTCDQAAADRVARHRKDDRDDRCRLLCCEDCGVPS